MIYVICGYPFSFVSLCLCVPLITATAINPPTRLIFSSLCDTIPLLEHIPKNTSHLRRDPTDPLSLWIGKEVFHGIINQGNDRLMRILIYKYSSDELGLRKTNRKKAKYLAGLNYCMIAYLCILLLTPLALVIFS